MNVLTLITALASVCTWQFLRWVLCKQRYQVKLCRNVSNDNEIAKQTSFALHVQRKWAEACAHLFVSRRNSCTSSTVHLFARVARSPTHTYIRKDPCTVRKWRRWLCVNASFVHVLWSIPMEFHPWIVCTNGISSLHCTLRKCTTPSGTTDEPGNSIS